MFGVRKRGDEEIALEVSLVGVEKVVCSLHCRRPAALDMRESEAKRADMKNTRTHTHKVVIFGIGTHSA